MNISQYIKTDCPSLDPHAVEKFSIVSHAHGDHVAYNSLSLERTIICSHETADLIRHRSKESRLKLIPIHYEKKYLLSKLLPEYKEEVFVTLYSAGHVLGSSQILIETKDISLLYTGDFKMTENLSCPSIRMPQLEKKIDYLIMESTFGKRKYVFPKIEEIQKKVIAFCNVALETGNIPILLAYSLGKSQEVLKLLQNNNFKILLHESTFNISKIYEKHGIDLGTYEKYSALYTTAVSDRTVLLFQPHFSKNRIITNIKNRKVCVLTGWALDSSAQYIHNADEGLPLSDHADFNDLITYAKHINPTKILITHGFAKNLASELNRIGMNADVLDSGPQMGMF